MDAAGVTQNPDLVPDSFTPGFFDQLTVTAALAPFLPDRPLWSAIQYDPFMGGPSPPLLGYHALPSLEITPAPGIPRLFGAATLGTERFISVDAVRRQFLFVDRSTSTGVLYRVDETGAEVGRETFSSPAVAIP